MAAPGDDPIAALVDAHPMAAVVDRVVIDADGEVVDMVVEHANRAALDLFTAVLPPGWRLGSSIRTLQPEVADALWGYHVDAGRWRDSVTGSMTLPDGTGGRRVVEFHQAPVPPDRMVAFFVDRTERERLRRSEATARARLDATLDALPDGLVMLHALRPDLPDSTGWVVETANEAARVLVPALAPGVVVDPDDPAGAALAELAASALTDGGRAHGRRAVQVASGWAELDWSTMPVDDASVLVVLRDLGETRRLEEQVHQAAMLASRARRLLYVALDSSPNPFAVLRVHRSTGGAVVGLTYDFLNEPACPPGLEVRDVVGLNLLVADPGAEDSGLYDEIVAAADDAAPHRMTVTRPAHGADGETRVEEVVISRVDEERVVMTAFDVTRLTRAQREAREARDAAVAASHAKSDFLATITHELRTPLTTILGATDLLLDTELDGEQHQLAQRQRDGAEVLLALVNDILDLSKIEAGHLELEALEVDPRNLVGRSLGMVSGRAEAKGLDLGWSAADAVPPVVIGDPVRLQQVLLNLLSNAVKFTDSGTVDIRLEVDDALPADGLDANASAVRLRFEVRDTGIGMTRQDAEKLFQPFVQADASTTRRYGGSGLGLSIARRLVERMDGEIGVDSEPGRGSRFWFTAVLGLPDPSVAALPAPAVPAAPPGGALGWRPKVLLAEDNDVNRVLVTAILGKIGCDTEQAATGVEAVAAVQRGDYDLILMDVRMPEMDGLEATRRIRAREAAGARRTTILALTANATRDALLDTERAGMDGFLSKPINKSALEGAIRLWCRPRSTQPDRSTSPD
ncbi:MAG: ATP-binding protein [Candidatus Nanopelagicales bacterium]